MAATAASLIWSGVSKSGSPTDRLMMSRPWFLRSRAFCVMAMVADGFTRDRTSARKAMGVLRTVGLGRCGADPSARFRLRQPNRGQTGLARLSGATMTITRRCTLGLLAGALVPHPAGAQA